MHIYMRVYLQAIFGGRRLRTKSKLSQVASYILCDTFVCDAFHRHPRKCIAKYSIPLLYLVTAQLTLYEQHAIVSCSIECENGEELGVPSYPD
jgi:hypothetical protein